MSSRSAASRLRKRLVEQHQRRARGKAAGDRDALLLAAGEFARMPVAIGLEAGHLERVVDPRPALSAAGRRCELQAEGEVALDAHVRPQRVVLEDHADPPLLGRHALPSCPDHPAVERDRAIVGIVQPGDDAQKRRLAGAARAEQRDDLAGGDIEIERLQHRACRRASCEMPVQVRAAVMGSSGSGRHLAGGAEGPCGAAGTAARARSGRRQRRPRRHRGERQGGGEAVAVVVEELDDEWRHGLPVSGISSCEIGNSKTVRMKVSRKAVRRRGRSAAG